VGEGVAASAELIMGEKHSYPTSAQLDAVVIEIYRAVIPYADAVREFKKQFILTALREANWNESKAAPVLRMHRNTLRRTLRELNLDARALRKAERRQVRRVDLRQQKKLAS
jgi:Fis family transcriptional regulator, factor for inversion stimulation protein